MKNNNCKCGHGYEKHETAFEADETSFCKIKGCGCEEYALIVNYIVLIERGNVRFQESVTLAGLIEKLKTQGTQVLAVKREDFAQKEKVENYRQKEAVKTALENLAEKLGIEDV